jgi:hypothetical protein
MALLTKTLDPTRPVIANDGWEGLGGDVIGIHDYDADPERLRHRYELGELAETLTGYGNNGRLQLLDDPDRPPLGATTGPRAIVLTEFGGMGFTDHGPTVVQDAVLGADDPTDRLHQPAAWGYSTVETPQQLIAWYGSLVEAVLSVDRLSGFCYTQFADTYQEVNGLLHADRTPKAPLEDIAKATIGPFRHRHGVLQHKTQRAGPGT